MSLKLIELFSELLIELLIELLTEGPIIWKLRGPGLRSQPGIPASPPLGDGIVFAARVMATLATIYRSHRIHRNRVDRKPSNVFDPFFFKDSGTQGRADRAGVQTIYSLRNMALEITTDTTAFTLRSSIYEGPFACWY